MPKKLAIDDSTKQAVLTLLERGEITQIEAARLSGVSRQLIAHWSAEIDIEKARAKYLAKLWAKASRPQAR